MSRNDSTKEVEKMPKVAFLCCHDCNVSTRVPCIMCRNFPCLHAGGRYWATPVSLAALTWSNELVDSNVWWAWQWLLFIILVDSDDDSNLSDDSDEITN